MNRKVVEVCSLSSATLMNRKVVAVCLLWLTGCKTRSYYLLVVFNNFEMSETPPRAYVCLSVCARTCV